MPRKQWVIRYTDPNPEFSEDILCPSLASAQRVLAKFPRMQDRCHVTYILEPTLWEQIKRIGKPREAS